MLQRRKAPKHGLRESAQIRSHGHLKFVRGFTCILWDKPGHECSGRIHAHHAREGANGGMGLKPGDDTAVPLCDLAHAEIHNVGWKTFEARYGVDLSKEAEKLWNVSRHRHKFNKDGV